ncbi:MAG: succinate dehydrogenase [Rhodospirillaceae bacterium]
MNLRLYIWQRISAMVMAPLVLAHLAGMIYAIQGGLSAAEILSRTQGNPWWGAFYGLFVLAVSIHAAIGLRVIAGEHSNLSRGALDVLMWAFGLASLGLGLRAVVAVVGI